MVCKRIRGGGKVGGPPSYNTLLSAPLAHWAIITSRSEKLCVLLLLFIVTFYAFCFFSYSIGMLPFSFHLAPCRVFHLYKFDQFSRDTSHVSVRPIKTFLHDKPRRKFFPCTLVRENLSNFVQNLQTSSCFYKSGNHGLTQSSHQVFNYVALTKS